MWPSPEIMTYAWFFSALLCWIITLYHCYKCDENAAKKREEALIMQNEFAVISRRVPLNLEATRFIRLYKDWPSGIRPPEERA